MLQQKATAEYEYRKGQDQFSQCCARFRVRHHFCFMKKRLNTLSMQFLCPVLFSTLLYSSDSLSVYVHMYAYFMCMCLCVG